MQPDRVTGADGQDLVGNGKRGERGGIASRSQRVVAELFVVFEAESAVDDGEAGEPSGEGEDVLEGRGAQLRPPLGLGDAGQCE